MKICLITESIPYPPDSGKELPVAEIFGRISQMHETDILVISNIDADFQKRRDNLPDSFRNVFRIRFRALPAYRRIWNELSGKAPAYFYKTFFLKEVKDIFQDRQYDFIWVSPAGNYSFILFCRENQLHFYKYCALGLNDVKTTLYADSLNEFIGFGKWRPRYLFHWLRSFLIKKVERKYLNDCDLVHVQTILEKKRAEAITGKPEIKILAAPNGIKRDLLRCTYRGIDSNKILYMTHLNRGRKTESQWFITKVWPDIKQQLPEAELLIVGRPPDEGDYIPYVHDDPQIKILGFAGDLAEVFDQVRMAIVPIFHGTGLINRILDALIAAVPVVSTPAALATIDGLVPEIDALAASDGPGFADQVVRLFHDRNLRISLSEKGRQNAKQRPDWEDTTKAIVSLMEKIAG